MIIMSIQPYCFLKLTVYGSHNNVTSSYTVFLCVCAFTRRNRKLYEHACKLFVCAITGFRSARSSAFCLWICVVCLHSDSMHNTLTTTTTKKQSQSQTHLSLIKVVRKTCAPISIILCVRNDEAILSVCRFSSYRTRCTPLLHRHGFVRGLICSLHTVVFEEAGNHLMVLWVGCVRKSCHYVALWVRVGQKLVLHVGDHP